jgi:hypothetical protein
MVPIRMVNLKELFDDANVTKSSMACVGLKMTNTQHVAPRTSSNAGIMTEKVFANGTSVRLIAPSFDDLSGIII